MDDGLTSLTCSLEGARCAGCITKIEHGLGALDGVVLARGNVTNKRLRLVYDRERVTGAALIETVDALGYRAHPFDPTGEAGSARTPSLLGPLAVAGFAMMNIMTLSFSVWFGLVSDMGDGTMTYLHWIAAALAVPTVLYSGAVFYQPALRALRQGRMTMDTPITLAILVTFAASIFETLRGSHHVYYDAVVALIFFLLIGRVLEQRLRRQSGQAAENLRQMMNVTARRRRADGSEEVVAAEDLRPGDVVLLVAGDQIPADGVLLQGTVTVDESPMTGESVPVSVSQGGKLAAGCLLASGPATLRVTHVGAEAQIGRMAVLAEEAAQHKGRVQDMADRFAKGYVPTVLIGGCVGFGWWYFVAGAPFADALMIAVAVLVVTCPCAAGLATPAVSARAVDLLMREGIVLKSGAALEALATITRVFADKTGTLTTATLKPSGDIDALTKAAPLAAGSVHPLARALTKAIPAEAAPNLREIAGEGVMGPDGARLGSAAFAGAASEGEGPEIWYRDPDGTATRFAFAEEPRPGLSGFTDGLGALGIPLTLLSGDRASSVRRFADAHGIADWRADLRPDAKLTVLREQTDPVLMLGDGINDAPALAGAPVSASFSQATQVAQAAADIVLLSPDPARLIPAIVMARQAGGLIRQNLRFATVYNLVTVPLALCGFLSPLLAAILMSSSSVAVLANGLRLRMPR